MNLQEALEVAHYVESHGYDKFTTQSARHREAAQVLGSVLRNRGFASVSAMEQELKERLLVSEAADSASDFSPK